MVAATTTPVPPVVTVACPCSLIVVPLQMNEAALICFHDF